MTNELDNSLFAVQTNLYQEAIHRWARRKGFWPVQHSCSECGSVNLAIETPIDGPAWYNCGFCKHGAPLSSSRTDLGVGYNDGEKIALMHSELSEALEGLRKGDEENLGEELADTVIRIMDYAEAKGVKLGSEILKKMTVNEGRPYKHNKEF